MSFKKHHILGAFNMAFVYYLCGRAERQGDLYNAYSRHEICKQCMKANAKNRRRRVNVASDQVEARKV